MAARGKTEKTGKTAKKSKRKKAGVKRADSKNKAASGETAAEKGGERPVGIIPKVPPAASAQVAIEKPTTAPTTVIEPKNDEDLNAFLDKIDAPSLHDEDLVAAVNHLNSVIAFRLAVRRPTMTANRAISGKCYEKSFGDSMVTIYENQRKIDKMTEESALLAGILRCGV
jgi:hypothetical protein